MRCLRILHLLMYDIRLIILRAVRKMLRRHLLLRNVRAVYCQLLHELQILLGSDTMFVWNELSPNIISKLRRHSLHQNGSFLLPREIRLKIHPKNSFQSFFLHSVESKSLHSDLSNLCIILLLLWCMHVITMMIVGSV